MNASPVVSIIIPIYKVEHSIERCACSLLEQTFRNLEFIFVNDCSPDNSIQILKKVIDRYPERKDQITILNHENNKGVAAARNTGLDKALGEYFLQVDSDDWVETSMVEELYIKATENNSDIVWSDFYVDFPNKSENSIYRKQNVPDKGSLCIIEILSGFLHAGLWNKIIKRSICIENNIRFPEEVNLCEDLVFIILYLLKAEQITYIHKAFYHYVQNSDSITIARTRRSFNSELNAVRIIEGRLSQDIYRNYILIYKSRIKRNMFFSGLFGNNEFLKCFPESSPYIFIGLNGIEKTAIWFSLRKFFFFARIVLLLNPGYSKIKQAIRR
jgi:glycosyltransferase involved in cell wall biosynthesis